MGRPIASRWTRIWCVRPVSRRTSRSVRSGRASRSSNHVTASRGVSVSSEWRVRSPRSRPIGAVIRPVRERDALVRPARVDDEASGLVDDEEVLVLVDDRQVELDRRQLRCAGELDLDLLPTLEPVALRARPPVDEHRAARHEPLRGRARAYLGEGRDDRVEPAAGVGLRSAKAERCQPGRSCGRRRRSRGRAARPRPR